MCDLMICLANDSSNSPSFGCIVSTNHRVKRKQASGLISLSLSFSVISSMATMVEAPKLAETFFF